MDNTTHTLYHHNTPNHTPPTANLPQNSKSEVMNKDLVESGVEK
jgi:hypothetical protein